MAVRRIDRETVDKLASLGYVGAGASRPPRLLRPAWPDPKDFIALYNRLRRANTAIRDRRFEEAVPILREAVAPRIRDNAFAQQVHGQRVHGMIGLRLAIEQFRSLPRARPHERVRSSLVVDLLPAPRRAGPRTAEAEATLALDPRFSDARILRGGCLPRAGLRGGHQELRTAVETDPAKPMIRLDLAKCWPKRAS